MIRIAKEKKTDVQFSAGDFAQLEESDFEFASSLFNVVNCLNSLDALTAFFRNIADRLQDGGMFLAESWNPIAVIAAPPTVVERVYEGPHDRIVRKVSPFPDFFRQRLDLRYDIDIFSNDTPHKKLRSFSVVHKLILFTPLEIEFCLQRAGFSHVEAYTAPARSDPGNGIGPDAGFCGQEARMKRSGARDTHTIAGWVVPYLIS